MGYLLLLVVVMVLLLLLGLLLLEESLLLKLLLAEALLLTLASSLSHRYHFVTTREHQLNVGILDNSIGPLHGLSCVLIASKLDEDNTLIATHNAYPSVWYGYPEKITPHINRRRLKWQSA